MVESALAAAVEACLLDVQEHYLVESFAHSLQEGQLLLELAVLGAPLSQWQLDLVVCQSGEWLQPYLADAVPL